MPNLVGKWSISLLSASDIVILYKHFMKYSRYQEHTKSYMYVWKMYVLLVYGNDVMYMTLNKWATKILMSKVYIKKVNITTQWCTFRSPSRSPSRNRTRSRSPRHRLSRSPSWSSRRTRSPSAGSTSYSMTAGSTAKSSKHGRESSSRMSKKSKKKKRSR